MSKKEVKTKGYLKPFSEVSEFFPEVNWPLMPKKEEEDDLPLLTFELLEKDESVQDLKFILNAVGIVLDSPMTFLIKTVFYLYNEKGVNISIEELIELKRKMLKLNQQKEDGNGL